MTCEMTLVVSAYAAGVVIAGSLIGTVELIKFLYRKMK